MPEADLSAALRAAAQCTQTDALLGAVRPSADLSQRRHAAIAFVSNQIHSVLNLLSFETSGLDLGLAKASDGIQVTTIIPQHVLPYWYSVVEGSLMEAMQFGRVTGHHVANVRLVPMSRGTGAMATDRRPLEPSIDEYKVACTVDGFEVEIVANNIQELQFLLFLQEIQRKNALFLPSFRLLCCWWDHATSTATAVSAGLLRHALAMMLVSVFNLQSPASALHALVLFLQAYQGLTARQVVTLQGIVPLVGLLQQPMLVASEDWHLVPGSEFERFWFLFNPSTSASAPIGSSGSSGLGALPGALGGLGAVGSPPGAALSAAGPGSELLTSMARALSKYENSCLNVMHPFTHANMVSLSPADASAVVGLFAEQLVAVVKELLVAGNVSSRFFGYPALAAHSTHPGLAHPAHAAQPLSTDMWLAVHYSNFVNEGIITEEAIKLQCVDILNTKGTLPVGEIGKALAEMTSYPQRLTMNMKEKFGGLKKFLLTLPQVSAFDVPCLCARFARCL